MVKPRTAFEKDLQRDLKDPRFRAEYEQARARIDAIDQLLRDLDDRRRALGLTKAELARRANANEVVIRRLFSSPDPNPTFATLVDLAHALGLKIGATTAPVGRSRVSRTAGRRMNPVKAAPRIRRTG